MRICALSSDGLAWYEHYLAAAVSGEQGRILPLFEENCVCQLNDFLPLYGRSTVALGLQRFRASVEDWRVEILNIYGTDFNNAAELLHHYIRKDGTAITVPAATFLDRNELGLITSVRGHVELAPVFA